MPQKVHIIRVDDQPFFFVFFYFILVFPVRKHFAVKPHSFHYPEVNEVRFSAAHIDVELLIYLLTDRKVVHQPAQVQTAQNILWIHLPFKKKRASHKRLAPLVYEVRKILSVNYALSVPINFVDKRLACRTHDEHISVQRFSDVVHRGINELLPPEFSVAIVRMPFNRLHKQ